MANETRAENRGYLYGLAHGIIFTSIAISIVGTWARNSLERVSQTIKLPENINNLSPSALTSPEEIAKAQGIMLNGSPEQKLFDYEAIIKGQDIKLSWTVEDCKTLGEVVQNLQLAAEGEKIHLPASSIIEAVKRRREADAKKNGGWRGAD